MKKLFSAGAFLLALLVVNSFAQDKNAAAQTNSPQTTKQTAPLSYGIIVDNSGSYRSLFERIIEIAKDIVEENKAEDETFLARFVNSDKIKVLQDFTFSKDELHSAADEMFIEGGLTAILDAVDFSAKYLVEKASSEPARRKVLVLITDGDDRQNNVKIDSVLKFLKDNQIQVFALGISEERVSMKVLGKLTKETGGKIIVPKTPAGTAAAVKELADAIRAQ